MTRLGVVLLALALGGTTQCSRAEPPSAAAKSKTSEAPPLASTAPAKPSAPARLRASESTWNFESTPVGRMSAVVLLPERSPNDRFPVLITFHGRGEALKGPERGARGWVDDYRLGKAIERLRSPPLTRSDFLSFVSAPRLAEVNAALASTAYRGLVIVCPYTPDRLAGDDFFEKAEPLARFLTEQLLPRIRAETPSIGTAVATGLDGVSLGGRSAYSAGLLRPEAFGVIAGLQAAFDAKDAPALVERARAARQRNPALRFRMLTSHDDYFLNAVSSIARAFSAAGLPMELDVVEGPHDYDFNRGPGAYEMLLFHDRVLRGEPSP